MKTLNNKPTFRCLVCIAVLFSFLVFSPLASAVKEESIQFDIKGVNKEIESNIKKTLTILYEQGDFATNPNQITQFTHRAKEEIALILQPYGYYSPDIQGNVTQDDEEQAKANFVIILGPAITISAISIEIMGEGENDLTLHQLLPQFPLKKGDIFVHENYEQGKKAILSRAIQSGYLNALFSQHRVQVDIDKNQAEIYLTLQTGERHFFGKTTFSQTKLSDKLLNRYVPFKIGEIYSPEKILILQSRLNQSDYFSQVNVKTHATEDSTLVPVSVELTDAKPNQYILGAGYGTDTGVRGKVGWTRRRVNSLGHRFTAQARVAEIYSKFEADYSIPGKHPNTDQIKFRGGYFDDEFSEKRSHIYEFGVLEERDFGGWQRRIGLTYQQERFNAFITNDIVTASLFVPSITLVQSKRNDLTNPTHGRRIELTMRGSADALLSNTSFFQTYLQIRWLHAFSDTFKTLIRTELGFTLPDDVENLPLSQRFFAGGDLSLRGYGYRSLPFEIDKNGERHPVGGTYLAVGSVELSKTVKKPVGIFTFVDFGNAFRENDNEIEVGTGVGLEWQTRLGPLKFAIAKPLTLNGDAWRIHASFGPEL